MADTKISALPAAAALGGADLVPVVQGGVTSKATIAQVATAVTVTIDALPDGSGNAVAADLIAIEHSPGASPISEKLTLAQAVVAGATSLGVIGGSVTIQGASGVTSPDTAANVTVKGGDASLPNGTAGVVTILGGTGSGIGAGNAILQGGAGAASGVSSAGAAQVKGGTPIEGNGGSVSITGGPGATLTATNRTGGLVAITAGAGANNNAGANVNITSGAGAGTGASGAVNISSGAQAATGNTGNIVLKTAAPSSGTAGTLDFQVAAVSVAKITSTQSLQLLKKLYPAQDTSAYQTSCGLYAGVGAPNNANGADGDIYFRSDGGALTTIYQRRAGTWTGIV